MCDARYAGSITPKLPPLPLGEAPLAAVKLDQLHRVPLGRPPRSTGWIGPPDPRSPMSAGPAGRIAALAPAIDT